MGTKFNVIAVVDTTEADLAPYPGGSATVPQGKTRNVYLWVLSNTSSASNTLTLRIYRGATLEKSIPIAFGAYDTIDTVSDKESPILVVPSGRTLKAVASAASITVLMTGEDK
ncbi:MAG: hypothetical protein ABIM77_08170 [candidate division WOR-3 bacterium]